MRGQLTVRERWRYGLLLAPLLAGMGLAIVVVANSGYQWMRIERFEQRFRPAANSRALDLIERNLMVNASAGLALLASTLFLGARLRYQVRAQRWEQQLALGRSVQIQLVPSDDAGGPHLRMAAEFSPAFEVGGDLYDVFRLEDGRVAFAVGDVAGKGLPAALLTGQIHGAVRANPWHRSPAEHVAFARQLNAMLHGRTSEVRSASLFWGVYDPGRERLGYVSAGHCPGLAVRADGVEFLESTGPLLGLLKNPRFSYREAAFGAGDVLVLYTDGLIEAVNEQGEEYGEQRLAAALERARGATAEQMRAAILNDYRAFAGNAGARDDITLLVLEPIPAGEPALAAA